MSAPPFLPWPPPGLEPMRGKMYRLAGRLGASTGCIMAALVAFEVYVPDNSRAAIGPAVTCSLTLALVGSLLLLSAALGTWRILSDGGAHVWRGYTWPTILEVTADRAGDVGSVIAGTGDFSGLPPGARNALRVGRMATAFAVLVAATLPLPLLLLEVSLASQLTLGVPLAIAIALAPSAVLMLLAQIAGRAEGIALAPALAERRKQFDRRADAIAIADHWYAEFDAARVGQSFGRGRAGGALRSWMIGAALSSAIALVAFVFVPVWFVAAVGSTWTNRMTAIGVLQSAPAAAAAEPMRQFVVLADSTITAAQAGVALHTLTERGATARRPFVKPPARVLPPFPSSKGLHFPHVGGVDWFGLQSPGILDSARKGLSPEVLAYLAQIAADPGWVEFGIVARAKRVDVAGAEFVTPFAPDVSAFDIPALAFSRASELASAASARAALYVAGGHMADAERVIRETISFGVKLIDDGNSTLDVTAGTIVVRTGRVALLRLFQITSDPRAAMLNTLDVSAAANANSGFAPAIRRVAARRAPGPPVTSSETGATALERSHDVTIPRGIRLDAARAVNMYACGNMGELLFGLPRDVRAGLAMSRALFVRSPAEGALFDLETQAVERPIDVEATRRPTVGQSALVFGARVSAWLMRRPRIANCALLFSTGGGL